MAERRPGAYWLAERVLARMEGVKTADVRRHLAAAVDQALHRHSRVAATRLGWMWAEAGGGLQELVAAYVAEVEQAATHLEGEEARAALVRSHTVLARAVAGWHAAAEAAHRRQWESLAHDIGSPLSAVVGLSYLVAQGAETPEAAQEYGRLLHEEATRLAQLFHALLRTEERGRAPRAAEA